MPTAGRLAVPDHHLETLDARLLLLLSRLRLGPVDLLGEQEVDGVAVLLAVVDPARWSFKEYFFRFVFVPTDLAKACFPSLPALPLSW